MKYLPIALCAVLALSACADSEPIGEETVKAEGPEPYGEPKYVDPLPEPAGAGAASMRWFVKDDGTSALFGPPESEAVVALRCEENAIDNNRLVFSWNIDASPDATETISMGWGNDTETFGVGAVENRLMPSGYAWTARFEPTGEEANFLLAAAGPITFTMGPRGNGEITVPADDKLKQVIQACQPED